MIDLAILGLLHDTARHGYELKTCLLELGFARVSFGTLYPALRRLEKQNLIRALKQTGRRKAYRLTAEGEHELDRILNAADSAEDRNFNMRLAFFRHLAPAARLRTLQRRRRWLGQRLRTAQQALQCSIGEGENDPYTVALLRHNIQTTEADIGWLDQLIAYARTEQDTMVPRTLGGRK